MILGRHYTPASVARAVVRRALLPLRGMRHLRILDPACGAGVFLAEARRFLGRHHHYVGVDLDPAGLARLGPGLEGRCADALRVDWGGERFDAVIGNPPWVSFSGRHAKPLSRADRCDLAARYETFSRWPCLHAPFVELAVRLARRRIGLLLPAQVLELERYGPLRAFVRRHCRMEAALDFGEQVFAGVTQPCRAVILRPGGSEGGERPFGQAPDPLAHCLRPPTEAFADIGVHTGNCARELLRPGGLPIREGRDIRADELGPPRRTLLADRPRQPGEYYRIGSLQRFREVPILVRQTAARPIAAIHREPTYFRNSAIACMGIEGVSHERVVAWLNSSVVGWFHRQMVCESGQRAFPQVKLRHLRNLPLPDWEQVRAGEDLTWGAFGLPGPPATARA